LGVFFFSLVLGLGSPISFAAESSESMAERTLKRIVERQKEVIATAEKQGEKLDLGTVEQQLQSIAHDYELLLRNNPNFAAGYAAYGYFLSKTENRREAMTILMKAEQLDPNIALVKNQIGVMFAEGGKPLQAVPYFLAAVKLEPDEPLYHFQLGTIFAEARDDFLKTGEWTRATIDGAMQEAFRRATELAPDRFEFAYRHAFSFYDLEKPNWDAALKAWSALEEKAETAIERQSMRLHAANVCLKMGKVDHAKALIATVDEPKLQGQKQKLVAQLPGTPKN
jgi:tetratricopeptide (TPR) repeat protein